MMYIYIYTYIYIYISFCNVKTYLLTYLPIAHMTNSLNFDDNDNLSLLNSDNIVFQPTATLN